MLDDLKLQSADCSYHLENQALRQRYVSEPDHPLNVRENGIQTTGAMAIHGYTEI